MAIKVALVEDLPEFHEEVGTLIQNYEDLRWKGAFSTGEAFLEELPKGFSADVVLMDFDLSRAGGKLTGVDCIREFRVRYPKSDTTFIMYTAFGLGKTFTEQSGLNESDIIFEAMKAGALGGYILKSDTLHLHEAIVEAYSGRARISGDIARHLFNYFAKIESTRNDSFEKAGLTKTEKEVLEDLIQGRTYQEIADKRFVSKETINTHVKHIYSKFNIHSWKELLEKHKDVPTGKICDKCGRPW